MKRITIAYFALGGLLCAGRWLDLAFWTDTESGLVTAGSVWWRYGALALCAALAFVAGRWGAGSAETLSQRQPLAGAAALAAALALAVQGLLCLLSPMRVSSLVQGVLALLCAAWLLAAALGWLKKGGRKAPAAAGPAIAASLLFAWQLLRCFMTNSSSWQRTVVTSAIWQQLAALLFFTALLRALCLPSLADARAVGSYGLLAFCLCFCWQLPQCVLLAGSAAARAGGWALCAVGLLGAACAWLCAGGSRGGEGAHALTDSTK